MEVYLLHELVYDVIREICYDSEYIYMSYISAFSGLAGKIYAKGAACGSGGITIAGIKSDYNAVFDWELTRPIGFTARDCAILGAGIVNKYTGAVVSNKRFILNIPSGELNEAGTQEI